MSACGTRVSSLGSSPSLKFSAIDSCLAICADFGLEEVSCCVVLDRHGSGWLERYKLESQLCILSWSNLTSASRARIPEKLTRGALGSQGRGERWPGGGGRRSCFWAIDGRTVTDSTLTGKMSTEVITANQLLQSPGILR